MGDTSGEGSALRSAAQKWRVRDLGPGHMTGARRAAIVLTGVEMLQARADGTNGIAQLALLDVHVERVEHDLAGRVIDAVYDFDRLRGQVDEARLEAVERLDAQHRAVIPRVGGQLAQVLDQQIRVAGALVGGHLPHAAHRRIQRSDYVRAAQGMHGLDAVLQVIHAALADGRVRVNQVAVRAHRRADAHAQAVVLQDARGALVVDRGGVFQRHLEPLCAEAGGMRRQLRDLLGGQGRNPDPGIYAELHRVLSFQMNRRNHLCGRSLSDAVAVQVEGVQPILCDVERDRVSDLQVGDARHDA